MSIRSRRPYIHAVFNGMCTIALANLEKIVASIGADTVDVLNVCGTDFGTQTSSFCSVATFRDLWLPYYTVINQWVHKNTRWKTFKHSCGAVEKFIPSFLDAGFDILNPVQCSAAGMEPECLKQKYGRMFWSGTSRRRSLWMCSEVWDRWEYWARCFQRNLEAQASAIRTIRSLLRNWLGSINPLP